MNDDLTDPDRNPRIPHGHARNRADRLVRYLVRHAARRAPSPLSDRLEEEWLADLEARRNLGNRLRFALGCSWAARVIAADSVSTAVPATATSAGASPLTVRPGYGPALLSRRGAVLLTIDGLHVALIYGLAHGLARVVKEAIVPSIDANVVELPHRAPESPPLLAPSAAWKPGPLFIPAPNLTLEDGTDVENPDFGHLQSAEPLPTRSPPSVPIRRMAGGPGAGFPNSDEFYPPGAIRAGEAGSATVRVCVDSSGHLSGAPSVAASSGIARLDAAALKLAAAGSGRYRPTLEDGQPVPSCYPFRITFSLRQ